MNTRAVIRPAEDDDLIPMLRMINRNPAFGNEDVTPVQWATWTRMMHTPDVMPYLAEVDGVAVGYTAGFLVHHLTHDCRPGLLIESMYVRPDQRRRGLATQMITALIEAARSHGVHKVQLLAHNRHAHDGAHALYRSVGFVAEAQGFRLYLNP